MKIRRLPWLLIPVALILIPLYLILWAPNYFDGDRFIIISKGDNFKQVADSLDMNGIVMSRLLFDLSGRILNATTRLQVGKYRFKSGFSNSEILDIIRYGKTVETISVPIPEGLRATTQAKIFRDKLGIDSARFMDLVNDGDFARELNVDGRSLMGYLMPKTYRFYWQTDEKDIIRTLVREFWTDFDEPMRSQAKRRGWSIKEVLTMASIIELETAIDSERAVIAGVYYNRLQRRMRLQADPTVQFALGGEPRRLRFSDLKIDSPFNTYVNYGLPPGPINNPGKASILAALYPARHRYLYFVATGVGGHSFSLSFGEHGKAKKEYKRIREEQRILREQNK